MTDTESSKPGAVRTRDELLRPNGRLGKPVHVEARVVREVDLAHTITLVLVEQK